ncbi:MAG: response regulator transcription factor [Sphingorhabdus sp.]
MRILVIEDEADLSRRLCDRLASGGFVVEAVCSAEAVFDLPDPEHWAAIVVDIGLPGMNGIEFISRWRQLGYNTPMLVLSAKGSWQEKVEGLNVGADDYVVKPVRSEELVARVHALVRRAAGQTSSKLMAGQIAMDPAARIVWRGGERLDLTQIEYRLLHLFLLRAGHILAQTEILDHLYPMADERDLNTIEVHIGRLRRKIGKPAITTIRGLGYRLEK